MTDLLRRQALLLETTEGVQFRLPLAGPLSRSFAWLIDLLCVFAASSLLGKAATVIGSFNRDLGSALGILLFFVVFTGYSMVLEWKLRGQTLGKRLLRLRVVDAQGLKLTLSQVVIRNLLRAIDMLPVFYAVGGIACLVTRHCQRLGDLAANTVVVCVEPKEFSDFVAPTDSHYNSVRGQARLVARLRQELTPEQARIALDAVLRRETLEPRARVSLFAEIANGIRQQVDFPEDCLPGLSDERLVIDVVESLFNEKR